MMRALLAMPRLQAQKRGEPLIEHIADQFVVYAREVKDVPLVAPLTFQ